MRAPTLLCVGHDAAPSRAFRKLISYAATHGYGTDHVLLDAGTLPPPSMESLRAKVLNADRVMIGMSTPEQNATIELAAAHMCTETGTIFGFYAENHGAWKRSHFGKYAEAADFLCVVNNEEARRAGNTFKRARIVASSNPLWAAYFAPADRIRSRAASNTGPHEYLVLVPGTKTLKHNQHVFAATVIAAAYLKDRHVVFARHPGDKSPSDAYEAIARFGRNWDVRVTIVETATDELVPGADLVINGSSVRIHALARKIPVIDYFDRFSQDWLEQDSGSRFGYFYGSGAVIDVYDSNWKHLLIAMQRIANHPELLVAAQSRLVLNTDEARCLSHMLQAADPAFA